MKILHTSDWHIGHTLYNYDRHEEQADMLRQIKLIAEREQPDVMVVSGDIYHTPAPSAAATRLYTESLLSIHQACPSMAIVVTAGNHDSASRIDSQTQLWRVAGINVVGGIARNDDGTARLDDHIVELPCGFVAAVPFAFPSNFPVIVPDEQTQGIDRQRRFFEALLERVAQRNTASLPVVLMAHLALDGADVAGNDSIGNIELMPTDSIGTDYDYAALGHIHHPRTLAGGRARYCGTPIPVSFAEQCSHGVSIVTIDHHGDMPTIREVPITNLRPLHTFPASDPLPLEEILPQLADLNFKDSYIRLNVIVDDFLPANAREQAIEKVQEMAGGNRFCTFATTSRAAASTTAMPELTVEQFRELQPLDVAQRFFQNRFNREMTDAEIDMFNTALQAINTQNAQ